MSSAVDAAQFFDWRGLVEQRIAFWMAGLEARLRLAAIVQSSDDAIIGKDMNGIITDWNNGAKLLYGYSASEAIGKPISILLPPDHANDFVEIMREIRAGKFIKRFETTRQKKDGTRIEVSLGISPILDVHGRIVGASTVARDISERKRTEEALRQKEKELSEAQRLAGVGSWYWDARKDIATWSEEFHRIAGTDPALPAPSYYKELPRHFTVESWERLQRAVEEALRDGTPYELDLEMVRPDGTTRWIRARGEALGDTTGRFVGLRGTAQDITERKLADEALASMSGKLLEAKEQERTRIARELHDDISQQLALLSVEIQLMKEVLPVSAGELRSRMNKLEKRISEISTSVHCFSHELHSSRLEYLGIVSAMKGFCKEFGDMHKVKVAFVSKDISATLLPEVSLCLFRVVQEGLHNALKHSGVKVFEVKLRGSPTEIQLTVRDSGVGFDSELEKDTQGLGLISMRERVKLVNGTISITARPESGTEINVRVPLSTESTGQAKAAGA